MTLRSRSLRIDADRCRGHMKCMRVCPTDAIRVRHGKAQLLPGQCIDCGMCLRACPSGAITPRFDSFTELGRFKHTIAIPSPALYAQFGRAATPGRVLAALQAAGFDEAIDMSPAIETVLHALRQAVRERADSKPLLSPFCPTVVRLIQARYPQLAHLIAPLESPQELTAIAVREHRVKVLGLRREQIGVIYITPCAAKMVGLKLQTRQESSQMDGAVAVSHIYGQLRAALANGGPAAGDPPLDAVRGSALNWALLGGQGGSPEIGNALAVGGLEHVIQTLEDIEKEKLREVAYVECRACRDGCVDGCLMIDNPYEARSKLTALVRDRGAEIDPDRPEVRGLLERRALHTRTVVPRSPKPLDEDMSKALEKARRLEELCAKLPRNDCGACGSPSCRTFAEDVVQGRVEEDDCVFLVRQRLRQIVADLGGIVARFPQNPFNKPGGRG